MMKKRLHLSLGKLLAVQFKDFLHYYLGAFVCLFLTHYIQSELPFLAKTIAENIEKGFQAVSPLMIIGMVLGILIFRTLSRLLFFYPARVLQRDLRVEFLSALEDAHPMRYKHYPHGQIFQILYNDMDQLRALIGFALLQLGNIVVAFSILIPRMYQVDPTLVVAFLPMGIAFILFSVIVSSNYKLYGKTQQTQGEVQHLITETYQGKKSIQNYQAESSFLNLFKKLSYKELSFFHKAGIGISISMPLNPLSLGLSLVWGAVMIRELNLGASYLVLFSGFTYLLLEPLMYVSWIGIVFTQTFASWKRIKELIHCLHYPSQTEKDLGEHLAKNKLKLWDNEVDLPLVEEAWTVFVGPTGSGKSTLLIQLANQCLGQTKTVSYVAQEPYLYNTTIMENIFLGNKPDEGEQDKARELLELFALNDVVSRGQDILTLEVGEHGKRLSGGQAKRLSLVRSLMSDAQVLLWDDPFSSVDVLLEKDILEKLKKHETVKGRTMALTTHRLTTLNQSDYVYYIDKERGLVEQGAVPILMQQKGEVYAYFKDQMVGTLLV